MEKMYIFQLIAACPTGTYWDDGLCILCPIGTYQDETGKQECTSCPGGYTTLYVASRNQTDCSGKIEFRHFLTIYVTQPMIDFELFIIITSAINKS